MHTGDPTHVRLLKVGSMWVCVVWVCTHFYSGVLCKCGCLASLPFCTCSWTSLQILQEKPVFIQCLRSSRCVCVCLSTHACLQAIPSFFLSSHVRHTHTHTYTCTHIHTYTCTHIRTHTYTHTHTHAHTHTCTQTYIASSDVAFAAATIQAIGRVACSISGATETCLHGLMALLSHKNGRREGGEEDTLRVVKVFVLPQCRGRRW